MFSADSWESFHPLSKKGKYIITATNNSKSSKGNNVWWSYVDMGFLFPGISRYFPLPWEILLFPGLLTTLGARWKFDCSHSHTSAQ